MSRISARRATAVMVLVLATAFLLAFGTNSTAYANGQDPSLNLAVAKLAAGSEDDEAAGETAGKDSKQATETGSKASDGKAKPFASEGVYYITLSKKRYRVVGMKDNDRRNNVAVVVTKKAKTNLVRFSLTRTKKGTYLIRNAATGRLLGANMSSKICPGKFTTMQAGKGMKCQQWSVVVNSDKTVSFRNVKTKTYLNLSSRSNKLGIKLGLKPYAKTFAQRFVLKKTAKNENERVELKVPCYMQNPQLPTGCESVALTNLLNYWGFGLWKTTIANSWMPYGQNGVYNFIGNPRDSSGWIICAPGIANTAKKYLDSKESSLHVMLLKGKKLDTLRVYLDRGYPIMVWTTIGMGDPGSLVETKSGYPLRGNNHAVVIAGYNPKTGNYLVADSLAGTVWRKGGRFGYLYAKMGRQAVLIHN